MTTTNVDRLVESLSEVIESGFNKVVDLILKQIRGEISEGERRNETNKIECDTVNFVRKELTLALSQARQEGREEQLENWGFAHLERAVRHMLKELYPLDVFDGSSGDAGPKFTAKLHEAITGLDAFRAALTTEGK